MSNVAVIGVAVAAAVALAAWPLLHRAMRSARVFSWPTISATVEEVVVRSYTNKYATTYRAEIDYSYKVGDEYYFGHYDAEAHSSEAEATRIAERHAKGTTLVVRVDPRRPEKSVADV